MPAEHFVPRLAKDLRASPRVEATALQAIAAMGPAVPEPQWRDLAAAALLFGARQAGESWDAAHVARSVGAKEAQVAKHLDAIATTLRKAGRI